MHVKQDALHQYQVTAHYRMHTSDICVQKVKRGIGAKYESCSYTQHL